MISATPAMPSPIVKFRKTHGSDVFFELELLFTAIHRRPPQLVIGLMQKT
jgi:hypothetical protein